MDGVRHFGGHRLVQRNRSSVTLNWMMLLLPLTLQLLTFQLLAFTLFPLSMGHLLLPLSLEQLLLPGVSLAFSVEGLRGGMAHRLADSRKRVTRIMGRGRMGLAVRRRLRRPSMSLAQLRQTRERVAGGLPGGMIRAWSKQESANKLRCFIARYFQGRELTSWRRQDRPRGLGRRALLRRVLAMTGKRVSSCTPRTEVSGISTPTYLKEPRGRGCWLS